MFKKVPLWEVKEEGLLTTRGSYCFAFEIDVPPGTAVEEEVFLNDVLQWAIFLESLFSGESLYFSFIAENSKDKSSIVDKFLKIHAKYPLNKKIAESKLEQIKDRLFRKNKIVFEIPVFENPQEFYKADRKVLEEKINSVYEKEKIITKIFQEFCYTNLNTTPRKLSGFEMWQHLFRMINGCDVAVPQALCSELSAREQLFLSDVYDEEGTGFFKYGKRYLGFIAIDALPVTILPYSGYFLFSKFPFELRMSISIALLNQVEVRRKLAHDRRNAVMFTSSKKKGNPEMELNRSKVQAIDELLAYEKEKIVTVSVTFAFEGETKKDIEEKNRLLQNIIMSVLKTASCYVDYRRKDRYFVSSLGYFPGVSYPRHYTTLKAACCFIPLRGSLAGTVEEPLFIFENRENSITALSLSSKRQSRWSFLVIGPTGSGKSFLVNHFVLSLLSQNSIVIIFDMAPMSSYATLARIVGGEYIEAKPGGRGIARNVFDFPLGFELPPEKKYVFLENFLSFLLSERNQPLSKEELEYIRRCIKRLYERYLLEIPKGITDERSRFKKYGNWIAMRDEMMEKAFREKERGNEYGMWECIELAEYAHKQAMPILEDLASIMAFDDAVRLTKLDREIGERLRRRLSLYLTETYKKLFAGTTDFKTITKNFIVINLGFLKEDLNLLVPTYLSYREFFWDKLAIHFDELPSIMRDLLGEEYFVNLMGRNKYILIDEYHNFNASREIVMLTDKDFRQSRTYGIAVGVITQSLRDVIYEGIGERYSIFESAANKFLLRHTSPENPQMEVVEYVKTKVGMTEKEKELFMSLRFVPGKYSEFFYMGEEIGKSVLRYRPVSIELWINTTHKSERYLRDGLIEKFFEEYEKDIKENDSMRTQIVSIIIDYLARNYPDGLVRVSDEERERIFRKAYEEIREDIRREVTGMREMYDMVSVVK